MIELRPDPPRSIESIAGMALRISPLVASACTAAWGAALIAAFLANRHHDVAYLPVGS
jgi:hypothetical protein